MSEDKKDTSAADKTGEPKLIAGKYKTVEEAEKAIAEKDTLISRQGQELGDLRKRVPATTTDATRKKDTETVDAENEQLAQALLVNPKGTLTVFAQNILAQAEERMVAGIGSALITDRFMTANPIVTKHYRLFKSLMLETDTTLSLEERLNKAKQALDETLAAAKAEGKQVSDAERAAKDKVLGGVVTGDGTDAAGKTKKDDEEVDTPESYMAGRRAALDKVRAAV